MELEESRAVIVVIDKNGPSIVSSFRNKNSFSIHSYSAFSICTPWVRGVSLHALGLICGDSTIADLDAVVIMPEELHLVWTLVAKRECNWFIPSLRLQVLHLLGQAISFRMLPCLSYLNFVWGRLVVIAVSVDLDRFTKGNQSRDSVCVFHHVLSQVVFYLLLRSS